MALGAEARDASVRPSPEETKQLLVIPIGVDVIVAQLSATDSSFNGVSVVVHNEDDRFETKTNASSDILDRYL